MQVTDAVQHSSDNAVVHY